MTMLYCCDPSLEVAHEIRSFITKMKGGLKGVINSFGVARVRLCRADELLSALDSQFNSLKLLDESPKRKKNTGGRQRRKNTRNPQKEIIRAP